MPIIDPENTIIVRQLREENEKMKNAFGDTFACDLMEKLDKVEKELERVTEERNAAMSFIPKNCTTCKYGNKLCDWCVYDPDGDLNWEWNGKAKE